MVWTASAGDDRRKLGSYDPGEELTYFSDSLRTFVVTLEGKVFQVGLVLTGLLRKFYNFWATWQKVGDNELPCGVSAGDALVGVDSVLGAKRALKTLTELELQGDYEHGTLRLAAQVLYEPRNWRQSVWYKATIESTARLQQTAAGIRLLGRITDYTQEDRIVSLTSRWQYPDNRYARSYSSDYSTTS